MSGVLIGLGRVALVRIAGNQMLMSAGKTVAGALGGYLSYQAGGTIARSLGYEEYEKPKFSKMKKKKKQKRKTRKIRR